MHMTRVIEALALSQKQSCQYRRSKHVIFSGTNLRFRKLITRINNYDFAATCCNSLTEAALRALCYNAGKNRNNKKNLRLNFAFYVLFYSGQRIACHFCDCVMQPQKTESGYEP